jgi:hypothetical protein
MCEKPRRASEEGGGASILSFSWQLVGGVGIGLSIGLLAVHIFHKIRHIEAEYFYIYLISIVLLSYSIANAAQTSGMLSSFFAGFVIGNKQIPYKKGLMAFCNSLSFITNVGLFILLPTLLAGDLASGYSNFFTTHPGRQTHNDLAGNIGDKLEAKGKAVHLCYWSKRSRPDCACYLSCCRRSGFWT